MRVTFVVTRSEDIEAAAAVTMATGLSLIGTSLELGGVEGVRVKGDDRCIIGGEPAARAEPQPSQRSFLVALRLAAPSGAWCEPAKAVPTPEELYARFWPANSIAQ